MQSNNKAHQEPNILLDNTQSQPINSEIDGGSTQIAQQHMSGLTLNATTQYNDNINIQLQLGGDKSAGVLPGNNLPVFHNAMIQNSAKGDVGSELGLSENMKDLIDEFSVGDKQQNQTTYDQGTNPINVEIKSENKGISYGEKVILGVGQEQSFDSIDESVSPIRYQEQKAIQIHDQHLQNNGQQAARTVGGLITATKIKHKGQSTLKKGSQNNRMRRGRPSITADKEYLDKQDLFIGKQIDQLSPMLNKNLLQQANSRSPKRALPLETKSLREKKDIPITGFMRQVGGISTKKGLASQFIISDKKQIVVQGTQDLQSLDKKASIILKNNEQKEIRDLTSIFSVKDACDANLRSYINRKKEENKQKIKNAKETMTTVDVDAKRSIPQSQISELEQITVLPYKSNHPQLIETGQGMASIIASPLHKSFYGRDNSLLGSSLRKNETNELLNTSRKANDDLSRLIEPSINQAHNQSKQSQKNQKNFEIEGHNIAKGTQNIDINQPHPDVEFAGDQYRRIKNLQKKQQTIYKLDQLSKNNSPSVSKNKNQDINQKIAETLQCKTHRPTEIPMKYLTEEQQILSSLKKFESINSKQDISGNKQTNQKAFEVNMQKKFPNSSITREFFRQRNGKFKDFKSYQRMKIIPGDNNSQCAQDQQQLYSQTARQPLSRVPKSQKTSFRKQPTSNFGTQPPLSEDEKKQNNGPSAPNTRAGLIQMHTGERQIKTQGGQRTHRTTKISNTEETMYTPRDTVSNVIAQNSTGFDSNQKQFETKELLSENSKFKNKLINEIMFDDVNGGTPPAGYDVGLDLLQFTNSIAQKSSLRNSGSFKQFQKIEKLLKNLNKSLNDKNSDDEMQLVELSKESNAVEVYTFFKERDQYLKGSLNQIFESSANQNVFKAYGLPEIFEHFLKNLFESQRADKTSLIKFFTRQKKFRDFEVNQMKQELEDVRQQLEQFNMKAKEEEAYKNKLFRGDKGDKFYEIQKEMKSLEDIQKRQENQGYVGPSGVPDSYSGVESDLITVNTNLMKQTGLLGEKVKNQKLPDKITEIPFDQFQIILEQRTSNMQKKTAFKTLERFFKDVKTSEKSCQAKTESVESEALRTLSLQLDEKEQMIIDKSHKIKVLQNEISSMQVKLSQNQKSIEKAIKEQQGQKELVWNSSNFNLEEVSYVAKKLSLCSKCQNTATQVYREAKQDKPKEPKKELKNDKPELQQQLEVAMFKIIQLEQIIKQKEKIIQINEEVIQQKEEYCLSNHIQKPEQQVEQKVESKKKKTEQLTVKTDDKKTNLQQVVKKKSSLIVENLQEQSNHHQEITIGDAEPPEQIHEEVAVSPITASPMTNMKTQTEDVSPQFKAQKDQMVATTDIIPSVKRHQVKSNIKLPKTNTGLLSAKTTTADRTKVEKPKEYKPDYGGLKDDKEVQTDISGPIVAAIKPMEIPKDINMNAQINNQLSAHPMSSISYMSKNDDVSPLQKLIDANNKSPNDGNAVMAKLGSFFKDQMDLKKNNLSRGSLKRGSSLAMGRKSNHKVDDMLSIRLGNFQQSKSPSPNTKNQKSQQRSSSKTSFKSALHFSSDRKKERTGTFASNVSPPNIHRDNTPNQTMKSPERQSVENNFVFKQLVDTQDQNSSGQVSKRKTIPLSNKNSIAINTQIITPNDEELVEPDSALPAVPVTLEDMTSARHQEELMAEISEQSREDASPNVKQRTKHQYTVSFDLPNKPE